MSFYGTDDGIYGVGVYGTASYGVVSAEVAITGVSATALTRTVHINAFEVDITEPLNVTPALTSSVGSLEFSNTVSLTGVVGTTSVGTVSPNVDVSLTGVSATGAVNTVTQNVTEKVTGVIGTFTVNAAGLSIRSINRVPVTGSPMTGSIGTLGVGASESITTGIEATGQIGTVKPNVAESATGVVGTFSVNTVTITGIANTTLTGVEGVGQIGEVEDQPLERITTGVQATGAVGSLTLHTAAGVDGVVGTFTVGTPTVTGVIFNFVANDYDRKRVVYVPRQDTVAERRAAA